jgi:hypothetical protein
VPIPTPAWRVTSSTEVSRPAVAKKTRALLTILSRHRRLHRVLLEEEVLEASVEQDRDGNALFGRGAEERKYGTERSVALDQVENLGVDRVQISCHVLLSIVAFVDEYCSLHARSRTK